MNKSNVTIDKCVLQFIHLEIGSHTGQIFDNLYVMLSQLAFGADTRELQELWCVDCAACNDNISSSLDTISDGYTGTGGKFNTPSDRFTTGSCMRDDANNSHAHRDFKVLATANVFRQIGCGCTGSSTIAVNESLDPSYANHASLTVIDIWHSGDSNAVTSENKWGQNW